MFLIGALLPFDHPLEVDLPLDQPPPRWLLALLALVGAALAALVASIGLLRFRRWGRILALAVTLVGAIAALLLVGSPPAGALGGATILLLAAAALAWLVGISLAYHSSVASRFRA
jgi:hypothetical protein